MEEGVPKSWSVLSPPFDFAIFGLVFDLNLKGEFSHETIFLFSLFAHLAGDCMRARYFLSSIPAETGSVLP